MSEWDDIIADKRFIDLPDEDKQKVADIYFNDKIVTDRRWSELDQATQDQVRTEFMKSVSPAPIQQSVPATVSSMPSTALITKGPEDIYSSFGSGVNTAAATMAKGMDSIATYISEKTGLPKGGLFEKAAKEYESNAAYWNQKIKENGVDAITQIVGKAAGGAVPGLADFALGPAYYGVKGAAEAGNKGESEAWGAFKGASERYITGRVLEALNMLKMAYRIPGMGGLGAAQATVEGGDVAESAGTMALYGIMGPRGGMGPKDVVREFKSSMATGEGTPAPIPEPPAGPPPTGGAPNETAQGGERRTNQTLRDMISDYETRAVGGDRESLQHLIDSGVWGDPLTGLLNKNGIEKMRPAVDAKPDKFYLDLDNFKQINDKLTHAGGDQIISEVGKKMREIFSEDDIAARHGGDEFSGGGTALAGKLERLRSDLENAIIQIRIPKGSEFPKDSGNILQNDLVLEQPGIRLSFGVGKTNEEAYNANTANKSERLKAGLRTERNKAASDVGTAVEDITKGIQVPGDQVARGSQSATATADRPATAGRIELPTPEKITHNPNAADNKWPSGKFREHAPFSEEDKGWLNDLRSLIAGIEAPGKLNPNGTVSTSTLPPHLRSLGLTKADYDVVNMASKGEPITWNQYVKIQSWVEEHKVAFGFRPGEGWPKPEDFFKDDFVTDEEVPFERGAPGDFKLTPDEQKPQKQKPQQQGLNLGMKGEDMRAPKKEGPGVTMDETELGKATNAAKDREAQERLFDASNYDPAAVHSEMEMPEIVQLVKKLTDRYPQVNKGKISVAIGKAIGFFEPSTRRIVISNHLSEFEGLAERVLAHELGHAVDFSGAPGNETMSRGNILGRIASLRKYMQDLLEEHPGATEGILTDADRARFAKEAERMAKEEQAGRQESGGTVPPEDILAIWRDASARDKNKDLYDYIAKLSAAEKSKIVKDAMKGISNITLRDQIAGGHYERLAQREKEIYQDLLRQEIIKRRLYEKETIMDELKKLTQIIKPFDDGINPAITKYRYSSQELYADAVSQLLVDPSLLKNTAPTFHKAFMSYLERKPDFKAEWDRLQDLAKDREDILSERQQRTYEGYKEQEDLIAENSKERKIPLMHEVFKALVEKNADLYEKVKEVKRRDGVIEDTKNPRYWTEQLPYINGPVFTFLHDVNGKVMNISKKHNITLDQIGEIFERMRVSTERKNIPNPGGMTEKTSLDALGKLKADLGPERFDALKKAYDDFQSAWQKHVVDKVREANMWSKELQEYAEKNLNYATFQHVREFTGKLEEQIGYENSARVFKQVGTFAEIRNPFVATIMKGMALVRAAEINMAKKATTDFLLRNFGSDTIQKAKGRFNGKFMEFKNVDSEKVGTIVYMEEGKLHAYYVPKGIAESFEREPHMAQMIMRVWNLMNVPIRNILVSRNPLWMAFNVPRDFIETWKNTPDLTMFKLLQRYAQAVPHAYKEAFKGELTPTVRKMYENKELVIERHFRTLETDDPMNELKDTMRSFGLAPQRYNNIVLKPLKALWDFLGNTGKFTERLGKVAGSIELQERVNRGTMGQMEKAHRVRQLVGTPDIHAGGYLKPFYNNIFLFSNVAMRGFYASYEAFRARPVDYLWKTTKYNVMPKLVMAAAAAGLLGDELKKIYAGVSEYYKTNYQVIPLGLTEKGKSVIITLPQDYAGTGIGALVWKASQGKWVGKKGMTAAMVQQTPYSFNPLLKVGADLANYLSASQVYDDYRGKTVISDTEAKAADWHTAIKLAKYEAGQLGANAVYRFEYDDPARVKSDLEKMLDYPPGNVIGRYLKVTDYGNREQLEEVTDPVQQKAARRTLKINDKIKDSIRESGGKYDEKNIEDLYEKLRNDGTLEPGASGSTFRQFKAKYNRFAEGRFDNYKIDAFVKATTSDEKAALLSHYKDIMPAKEYDALYDQLIEEGFLKRGTVKSLNRMNEREGSKK